MSSTYRPSPVISRRSSTRLARLPSISMAITCLPGSRCSEPRTPVRMTRRRGTDRGDDVLVAGAAAEVALDGVADLVIGGIRGPPQEVGSGHDHPRGAEPALEAVVLPERGLERMEPIGRGHALDRRDRGAVRLDGEHRAGLDRLAVDGHGARAALRGIAGDVGPGQVQVLAEELDQQTSRLDVDLPWHPVDVERNVYCHGWDLLQRRREGVDDAPAGDADASRRGRPRASPDRRGPSSGAARVAAAPRRRGLRLPDRRRVPARSRPEQQVRRVCSSAVAGVARAGRDIGRGRRFAGRPPEGPCATGPRLAARRRGATLPRAGASSPPPPARSGCRGRRSSPGRPDRRRERWTRRHRRTPRGGPRVRRRCPAPRTSRRR